ncbi:protein NRT1/ PTR FAMILY 5.2-like isoform X2 [Quercus robur]|uniref:protein NRT1/ PTR FAMILY 5.2-like isoform X2 n=1 Tax=Quercus robur TaxID=38942 RepID=UPI002162E0D6|nr:protein NRT1/ PTR FAMILY 5.2-like isoform X2 [Quercus robur]
MALEEAIDEYTQDGTVDLKGNPVLRSKRGGWKACWFVVVYEAFERMTYFGISSNLIVYLTNKLHQGTITSANNVTNWVGTIYITPILGAYIADAHLGRYWTFIIACMIYLSGMIQLTLSVSLNSLKPPPCNKVIVGNCKKASTLHLAVFYGALYTLAVGTGGTKPNISTIGADQFDEFNPKEKGHKLSFFNWWMFSIFFGTLFANTVLVYIQDNVGWTLGYGLPTLGLAISIAIFVAGTPFYRHKVPTGSPFTRMSRVVVAAIRKWRVTIPNDIKELHELDLEEYAKKGKYRINSTPTMSFKIPPASLAGFVTISLLISVVLYDRFFVRIMQKWTKNPRGITLLQRMGIGLVIHILIMAVASLTERYRLSVAKEHGLVENGGQVPLTIFILLPQFVLMGTADAFLEVAKMEFFYDQAPESMKSLGTSYSMTTLGIGNFLSSFLLSTVSHITKEHGHQEWILNDVNASHLDYYYAFFAVLNFLNFIFFLFVIKYYVYKAEVSDSIKVLTEELKGMTEIRD